MDGLLRDATTNGWRKAVEQFTDVYHNDPADRRFYQMYFSSERRADWHFLLDITRQHVVLDVGSGFGAVSCELSKIAGTVVALDPTLENVTFVDIRRGQEGISNICPVNAEVLRLPFPDSYFDLAVMIGVLEFVGNSRAHGCPVELQLAALKELHRVLKRGGHLYLAIENRLGYQYFLGRIDEHSGLRFTTIMPRSVANLYSRMVRRVGYRSYTHSYWRLKQMLFRAGFKDATFYSPIPEYRRFDYLVPLENTDCLRYCFEDLLKSHPRMKPGVMLAGKLCRTLNILKYLLPTFAVICEKR